MIAPAAIPPRARIRRPHLLAAALIFLLALIVLPPFLNINRFRRTIVQSISAGLGRPVHASSVELELFPLPGFVLHNLTVQEDPAFGAEPVMMAETVTATLRPSTLWHARVEIARLRFKAPSVNLVRNPSGQWNFESLLRNSPVLQSHSSAARRSRPLPFPYVEATDARVNFKFGPEKLPFSLEKADLAVWKESRHQWRIRIRARPVRTDLAVMDAGQIRGEGALSTGGPLFDAPIRASLEWRRVQLGAISRLLHGQDDGWRGTADWTAHATGTLSNVSLSTDLAIEEFRRAEFVPPAEMDLSAHCQARYVRANPPLDSIACAVPAGDGRILLAAGPQNASSQNAVSPKQPDSPQLHLALEHVPANYFLTLLAHIHPGVDPDATASGIFNGDLRCPGLALGLPAACTGKLRSTVLRLHLSHIEPALTLSPLLLSSSPPGIHAAPALWLLSPARVSLGAASPATLTGTLTSTGSLLQLSGPADLATLRNLARSFKIPAFSGEMQSIRGGAALALSFETTWLPRPASSFGSSAAPDPTSPPIAHALPAFFVPSRWTGSVLLHNAALQLDSFPLPIQLASGQVNLTSNAVEWTRLAGTVAHIPFDGSLRWQTQCAHLQPVCARSFTLHAANLPADRLQAALHPDGDSASLLNLMNPWAHTAPRLPAISGTVNADILSAGKIILKNAALSLHLQDQRADLTAISGRIFGGAVSGSRGLSASGSSSSGSGSVSGSAGGALSGTRPAPRENQGSSDAATAVGSIDWGQDSPVYTLHVVLDHIQPDRVAALWHEHWGTGSARVQIDLATQGSTAAGLAQTAKGKCSIRWKNGSLSPVPSSSPSSPSAAASMPPLPQATVEKFQQWNVQAIVRDRRLLLTRSRIRGLDGRSHRSLSTSSVTDAVTDERLPAQSVTGTVTFDRILDLELEPSGISIAGPLASPLLRRSHEPPPAPAPRN